MADPVQRQLGAFLRSLEQVQFLRFCRRIRVRPRDSNDGLSLSWDQWKDNKVIGVVAAKQNNPAYYESVVLHAFPTSSEGQELLRHMLSLEDMELLQFYREIMDKSGLVLHVAQRPQFTLEVLDSEQMDPARWTKAKRLAGIVVTPRQPETLRRAEDAEDAPPEPKLPKTAYRVAGVAPQPRSWSRGEKIAVASIIVTIILAVIGWIVLRG